MYLIEQRARRARSDPGAPPPSVARWTALCAAAEAVGMAASAVAGRSGQAVAGEAATRPEVAEALAIIVGGGLVEGAALGLAQSTGLARWLQGRRRLGWVLVTVALAGLGWAGASAGPVLSGAGDAGDGAGSSQVVVLLGACGLGLGLGAVLGAGQAPLLRGSVPRPWRWVGVSAAGWAVAMPLIFVGAGLPPAQWRWPAVLAAGAATGVVAGSVLGLVTGLLLPTLTRPRTRTGSVTA